MSKTILTDGDEGVQLIVNDLKDNLEPPQTRRYPSHVVYGGADLFSVETPVKFGRIALDSLGKYAGSVDAFAEIFGLSEENAAAVYGQMIEKLEREPVEDFRIDFEDGYGFRSDEEEDGHAEEAAQTLANAFTTGRITAFSGFRIKSFAVETYGRAVRTLDIFLYSFFDATENLVPDNFVVTLPKVTDKEQVKELAERLSSIEKERQLGERSVGIEIMIETPSAVIDRKGRVAVMRLLKAADGRCNSVHFGAYDYTAALGISSNQDIRHPASNFARSLLQIALADTKVRLVDSVTPQLPVAVYKDKDLSDEQAAENRRSVHAGWRRHFDNVSASIADGIYQSWDLHPNQLVARYAAIYSFFLKEYDVQVARFKTYLERSTKASLTGSTFDDAASVQGILNFFRRGLDCGAFSRGDIKRDLGLSNEDLDQVLSSIERK